MRKLMFAAIFLTLIPFQSFSQNRPLLMPRPQKMSVGNAQLSITPSFRIQLQNDDPQLYSAAERCLHTLSLRTGLKFAPPSTTAGALSIAVKNKVPLRVGEDESYKLIISAQSARLEANTNLGALRGLATFRQLLQQENGHVYLPEVTIEDGPEFAWRGLVIDVARHFIPVDILKRNIDCMELVKLNVLHLHLSDNEGFRVESKIFPKLQEVGSNGKYYTQQQIRDLIAYAGERGIVVIPEFDMPSHSQSWLAAYPELASSAGPFHAGLLHFKGITPKTTPEEFDHIQLTAQLPAMDPSRESTYEFLDRLIGEMSALFPAPEFHIGADENNGAVWLANPSIVAFMKEHHLADAPALQGYFVARVKTLVEKHGKRMAAWEDAFAGPLSNNTIFEIWSARPATDLTKMTLGQGNQMLVANGFYLDIFFPAHVHYLNSVMPKTGKMPHSPLGGEAAIWTELVDGSNLDARIWPRTGAIAERLWTGGELEPVDAMYSRLFAFSNLLDREGMRNQANYREHVKHIAAGSDPEPVQNLLDILVPLKGYKILVAQILKWAQGTPEPVSFDRVADFVLIDSQVKHEFRLALAAYQKNHDPAAEAQVRMWLNKWAANDRKLTALQNNSKELNEVMNHSKPLAELAAACLQALDHFDRGEALSPQELKRDKELLKAAAGNQGDTELAIMPELDGLIHGNLPPEPASYPFS